MSINDRGTTMADRPSEGYRVLFQGCKFDLALQPITLADGTTAERAVILHPGSVALVPMVDSDHICLIRNHRHSLGKTLLEIPAGTLDWDEPPDLCAARELQEETGYSAQSLRKIAQWYTSPGVSTEVMHLYLCEGLHPGPQRLELDEQIETTIIPFHQALALAATDAIQDAKTKLALLLVNHKKSEEPDTQPSVTPQS